MEKALGLLGPWRCLICSEGDSEGEGDRQGHLGCDELGDSLGTGGLVSGKVRIRGFRPSLIF